MYSFASQKTSLITEKGTDVIPGRGTKTPQAIQHGPKGKKTTDTV